jgi:signal transduction histidine kinase
MPALAALQFRWVGQVSDAEQDRMQRNVETAARQFRQAFDNEVLFPFQFLSVGPETARDEAWHRFATRRDDWVNQGSRPELVRNIYLVDADAQGDLRVRRWDNDAVSFQPVAWPEVLEPWHADFEQELTDFRNGVPGRTRDSHFAIQDMLTIRPQGPIVEPVRLASRNGQGSQIFTSSLVFGFTVLELNLQYVQQQLLPELVQRHFTHPQGDTYRVAVVRSNGGGVIYESEKGAAIDPANADVVQGFFERFGRPNRRDGPGFNRRPDEPNFEGRWQLLVQHQSGSLEAAVSGARTRNLALSFGVLILLSLSIGLLTVTSRRAQRLAEQQIEFVAGVSHELRTPVAVIKSAAENLSQGVVGGADRVKRYGQMIEGEARRLGEMVERVLQYAGIESGLGYGARAPLAPADIIQSAVTGALPLLGPETVNIHRDIPEALPPVLGDAAALQSAVQNLVANAVKYGGPDRWVGIKAEHAREHRRSEVRITVSDHGPGIPASELPHIWDPFYRGGDALAKQIHGNGLGLSLVKRIVAAHGGRVTVSTRAGAGSSFTIALPAAEPDASTSVTSGVRAPVHP